MRNDDGRSANHNPPQAVENIVFCFGIDRRKGIVEHKDLGFTNDCPCNGYTLLLSTGKGNAPLPHPCVEALRKRLNVFIDIGIAGSLEYFFVVRVPDAKSDVVENSVAKQKYILGNVSDLTAETGQVVIGDGDIVD